MNSLSYTTPNSNNCNDLVLSAASTKVESGFQLLGKVRYERRPLLSVLDRILLGTREVSKTRRNALQKGGYGAGRMVTTHNPAHQKFVIQSLATPVS